MFLRSKRVQRRIAVFLLLVFVHSVVGPTIGYALTGGPNQQEYAAFEEPGASDMVNLLTGDFTTSLPVVEVPGPEGSFSVPLSYHAGIGPDQQASWVGLGWTINTGAINRSINQYPDDALGETQSITVQDLTGTYGIHASNGIFTYGANTQTGSYGGFNFFDIISMQWANQEVTNVGLGGLNFGGVLAEDWSFNTEQHVRASMTILTWGAAGAAAGAAGAAAAIAKNAAMGIAMQTITTAAANRFGSSSAGTPLAPTAGYWQYSKKTNRIGILGKTYHIWLDQTRKEKMYGGLYLGKPTLQPIDNNLYDGALKDIQLKLDGTSETMYEFPPDDQSSGKKIGSDVNYQLKNGDEFYESNNPASVAYDNYNVSAAGISGAINPYRFEVGSISMPRSMSKFHQRMAPVRFEDYKVPFFYDGYSNSYYNHIGGYSNVYTPGSFHSGIASTVTSNDLTYTLNDVSFKSQRRRSDVNNSSPNLAHGNHVEWLSNADIKNAVTYPSKFIDALSAESPAGIQNSDRFIFRSNFATGTGLISASNVPVTHDVSSTSFSNTIQLSSAVVGDFNSVSNVIINAVFYNNLSSFQNQTDGIYRTYTTSVQAVNTSTNQITVQSVGDMSSFYGKYAEIEIRYYKSPTSQNSIGGFCITSADGTMYHFAIPIYDYDNRTEMKDVSDPDNKKSVITRTSAFASSWLLTAITGPDFIDRNSNGLADEGDWGYWVKFNYGKHSNDYQWRAPFSGDRRTDDNQYKVYSHGFKQLYYLNSIETRSHLALFLKDERLDGKGVNGKTTLRLDEIAVLSRQDYKKLIAPSGSGGYNLPDYSNKIINLCLSSSFPYASSIRNYLNANCLRRVRFSYEYDLCPGTPNSTASGKLTLRRLSVFGKNDVKVIPDYKFEYANNPAYGEHKWDGWGMYNSSGTSSHNSHTASAVDSDGAAWSLTKIITPVGSEISINYERDTYGDVSGTIPVSPAKKGGNLRVASLVTKNEFGNEIKTRYLYTKTDGTTSGTVSKEPDYIKTGPDFPFYNLPGYPFTPVLYSQVSVLGGILSNDNDYHTRTVFEFETPNPAMVTTSKVTAIPLTQVSNSIFFDEYSEAYVHNISNRTAKIGKLKKISVYEKDVLPAKSVTQLDYTEQILNENGNNYQGIFTEGVLMFDRVLGDGNNLYDKVNRTTTVSYPWTLKSVTNTTDNKTNTSENLIWDFNTGMVLQKIDKTALGVNVKTVIKPAYHIYPAMGSKASNVSNRNMMAQTAATYSYLTDVNGNTKGLLTASAQTWRSDWDKYRMYNSTTQSYSNSPEGEAIWRKGSSYTWKGDASRLNSDGTHTFSSSDEFNFSGSNLKWQYNGELVRFDHYGMPLESKDFRNIWAATKMGYGERLVIASASNASFEEIAFSSAEDQLPSAPEFFGGEVAKGINATIVSSPVHTGTKAISLSSGYGFVYKSTGIAATKKYRASVWANTNKGRIYYKIGTSTVQVPAPKISAPVAKIDGSIWYRIDLVIEIPNITSPEIEVGVTSADGSTVVFDDFRFQPFLSSMTTYVYNASDNTINCVLNDDNVFIRYEYNDRGLAIRTFSETISYGEKKVTESSDNFRRFNIGQ